MGLPPDSTKQGNEMIKAVIFDLDNTLYDAQQYFLGAFDSISEHISLKYNISPQEVYETLAGLCREKTSMYPYLFNDLLSLLHLDRDNPEDIVKIFNEYSGWIEPYPDVIPTFRTLQEMDYKLGIITDGNVERQKRKVELLRFESLFDVIIYAEELESKPSSLPFLMALQKLKARATDAFYVADNPLLDFKGAKEVGIRTIRVLRGEFANLSTNEHIDYQIEGMSQLLKIVG